MRTSSSTAHPATTGASAARALGATTGAAPPAYLATPQARVGSIIPREVVVWLQSLQLSRPVRVPRRDLANGFSVAEICSRYWPALVSMHSFENLLSTHNKTSNWGLLQKVFAKQGAPLSDKVVDGMMNGKAHYADVFLTQLYTLLTGKTVRLTALPLDDLPEPVEAMDAFEPTSVSLAAAHDNNNNNNTDASLRNTYSRTEPKSSGGATKASVTKSAAAALEELGTTGASRGRGAAGAVSPLEIGLDADRQPGRNASTAVNATTTTTTTTRTSHPMAQPSGPASLRTQRKSSVGGKLDASAGEGGHFLVDVHVRAATKSTTVVDSTASAQARGLPLGDAITTTTTTTAGKSGSPRVGSGGDSTSHPRASLVGSTSTSSPSAARSGLTATSPTGSPALALMVPNTAAIAFVEQVVRHAAERVHAAWEVTPRVTCPFALYFLQNEPELEAATSAAVWSALLSSLQELVALLRTDSTLMTSLTALFLGVRPSPSAQSRRGPSATSSTSSLPRAITFLSALLAQLAGLDPYHALALFQSGVLAVPAVSQWLANAHFADAEQFAALLCATTSPDRATAAALMPDLLSAVYEAATDRAGDTSAAGSGVAVFDMVLRAAATRLVRSAQMTRGQTAAASGTSPGTGVGASTANGRLHTAAGGGRGEKEDPLNRAMLHVLDFNAVAALAASAGPVRLMGCALATTAVRLGMPLSTVRATHTRLMFPTLDPANARAQSWQWLLTVTDDPALHVLRAQWLRALQDRLAALDEDKAASAASGAEGVGSATPDVLARLFAALAEYVAAPGGHIKAKALVTYELAGALLTLPATFSSTARAASVIDDDVRDGIADTVVAFLATRAPADIVAAAVGQDVPLLCEASRAGTSGVEVQSGLVWSHPLLGPLRVSQLLARSAPLFLSGAVARLANGTSANGNESRKESVRRLTARAAILAKEGNVSVATRLRVEWLYLVTVGYSGEGGESRAPTHLALPTTARQLSGSAVAKRWTAVLQDAYVDFLLVLSAEELIVRMRQAGGTASSASAASATSTVAKRPLTAQQEEVLALAVHVRVVIRRWFTDLSPSLGGDKVTTSQEDDLDAKAVTWYHRLFGDVDEN